MHARREKNYTRPAHAQDVLVVDLDGLLRARAGVGNVKLHGGGTAVSDGGAQHGSRRAAEADDAGRTFMAAVK